MRRKDEFCGVDRMIISDDHIVQVGCGRPPRFPELSDDLAAFNEQAGF